MKFRKKPVVIEAVQHSTRGGLTDEIVEFVGGEAERNLRWSYSPVAGQLHIHTLEGRMDADPGDWIIRGIKGELYPCKPDIFEATYEPVRGEGGA